MTREEKIRKAVERQREIVAASKAAGNESLTESEQREFDAQQTIIDTLRAEEQAENEANMRSEAAQAERARITSINNLCRDFNVDPTQYIDDANATIETVRAAILENLRNNNGPADARVTTDEADKFRDAAADGLLMRAGVEIGTPCAGANDFRNFSLRELGIESLVRDGKNERELRRMDSDELFRQFLNPTNSFSAILDRVTTKSIVEIYKSIPTTFQHFTSKGTLTDFKESKASEYLLDNFGEFAVVPEGGELPSDKIGATKLPTRTLETRGKSFTLTRQAFINDDIDLFSKLPAAFAKADKMTIEREVYRHLFNNNKIFDEKAFFCAEHKNVMATGSAPSVDSITTATYIGQNQTAPNGDTIFWAPKFIITGIGYRNVIKTILHSQHLPGTSNNDINPLYNEDLVHIESALLNQLAKAGACPWFLAADPLMCKGIQVDYLNGNEVPTVKRSETTGVLGLVWDVWHDWKVNDIDYRGFVKNPGVAIPNPLKS